MNLNKARRIVIKIGSALLVDQESGSLHQKWLKTLVEDAAQLHAKGKEVVIVSSGAVALGRKYLNLTNKTLRLEEKQAAAACGQVELVRHYQKGFEAYDIQSGQVLLTLQDSEDRKRYLNARTTLETLLAMRIIPIINENDTVATAELRFGDNDRLAARVAQMVGADTLVLLSDIDGLYSANPQKDKNAVFIPKVQEVTPAIEAMAGGSVSHYGSGGMITKIQAAKIAVASGCNMVITAGKPLHPIKQLEEGARCTWFLSQENPVSARKKWIVGSISPTGVVVIDDGALEALRKGKSLLPAGVKKVSGSFNQGDAVIIQDMKGKEVGRGLIAYTMDEAKRIIGKQSKEIEKILGFSSRSALIHRDDMVVGKLD